MKFRLLAMLALIGAAGANLFGQDLGATWQGTLKTPAPQLRIVFKVAKAADRKFSGQGFSIDQGAQPSAINSISVDGRTVKWKIEPLSASYEGAFTADGNSINGTMTQ